MTSSIQIMANFHPQVWLDDNNWIEVPPPEGLLSEWDCTDHLCKNIELFAGIMRRFLSAPEDLVPDGTEYAACDPAAPEWIRNWKKNFPYEVYLRLKIT